MTDLPPLAARLMRDPIPAAVIAAVLAAACGGWVRRRLGMRVGGGLDDPLRPWPARAWGAAAAAVAWPFLFIALTADWEIDPGGGGL